MARLARLEAELERTKNESRGAQTLYETLRDKVTALEDENVKKNNQMQNAQRRLDEIPPKIATIDEYRKNIPILFKKGIIDQLSNNKLKIGATFTPEMISDDSKIYMPM